MKIIRTKFKDLLIYNKEKYKDSRGFLRELYIQKHFKYDTKKWANLG